MAFTPSGPISIAIQAARVMLADSTNFRTLVGAADRAEYLRRHGEEYERGCCKALWESPQVNWDGRVLGCAINYWGDLRQRVHGRAGALPGRREDELRPFDADGPGASAGGHPVCALPDLSIPAEYRVVKPEPFSERDLS